VRVTEDIYVSLSDAWHLRAEGGHGVLFHYDPEALVWYTLTKEQVCALLLMDGSRTLLEVKTILEYLFDKLPTQAIKKLIEALLEKSTTSQEGTPFLIIGGTQPTPQKSRHYDLKEILSKMEQTTREEFQQVVKGRLTAPLNLTLMPSNNCATDCIYCYSERAHVSPEEHLSLPRWLDLIDEAASLGAELAIFSGGDPLTYPHILPILERMLAKGFNFVLPSKTLVTKELAAQMAEIGMGRVWNQVSVDAVSPETAQIMTACEGYLERAFQSIANMVGAGLKVRVNCVATPLNYRELPDLLKELHRMGVLRAGVSGYGRSYYQHQEALFLSQEQMDWLNETVEKVKGELEWPEINCSVGPRDFTSRSEEERRTDWKERAKCSGGRSSLVITPSGKVTLCEQMPVLDEYVVGDLKNQSIAEVWRSERLQMMIDPPREKFRGTACESCEEYEECHDVYGYCFRDALFTYGTVCAPTPACPYAPPGIRMA